jgi:hypothetical protein
MALAPIQKEKYNKRDLVDLCKAEGWRVFKNSDDVIFTEVEDKRFKLQHPFDIYAAKYRNAESQVARFDALKNMNRLAWPHYQSMYNDWEESIFYEFCDFETDTLVLAGGASCGKSMVAAKVICLDWMADYKGTGAVVASTDLDSLEKRIYGYVHRLMTEELAVPFKFVSQRGNKPKIKHDRGDAVHCIAAVPSKKGGEAQSIAHLIGTHPRRNLRMVIDEATDCPPQVLAAKINLRQGVKSFKLIIVGNSHSRFDLHGSQATPENGWDSIDPTEVDRWKTKSGGTCLYFNPYKSPAIVETDEWKKELLSQYFMTEQKIQQLAFEFGPNSPQFYRFVLGFWPPEGAEGTVISESFLSEFDCGKPAHFAGVGEVFYIAGLDPAFTQGGDKCILRIARLGIGVNGEVLLDFMGQAGIYILKINAKSAVASELQIADQVIKLLAMFKIPLGLLAIDSTGQGRGLGEVIRLRANVLEGPMKISCHRYGTGHGGDANKLKEDNTLTISTHELWMRMREFIQNNSIRGLDVEAMRQFTMRKILKDKNLNRMVLESKAEFKARLGSVSPSDAKSPDEADSACITLFCAIHRYGFVPGQTVIDGGIGDGTHLSKEATESLGGTQKETRVVVKPSYKSGWKKR